MTEMRWLSTTWILPPYSFASWMALEQELLSPLDMGIYTISSQDSSKMLSQNSISWPGEGWDEEISRCSFMAW